MRDILYIVNMLSLERRHNESRALYFSNHAYVLEKERVTIFPFIAGIVIPNLLGYNVTINCTIIRSGDINSYYFIRIVMYIAVVRGVSIQIFMLDVCRTILYSMNIVVFLEYKCSKNSKCYALCMFGAQGPYLYCCARKSAVQTLFESLQFDSLCILPSSLHPTFPPPFPYIEPRYLKCGDPGEVPEAQDANLTSSMHTLVGSYIRTEVFGCRCHRPELSAPNNMHCADCAPHSITLYSNTQLT